MLWPTGIPCPTAVARPRRYLSSDSRTPSSSQGPGQGQGADPVLLILPSPGRMREDPTSRMGRASSAPGERLGFGSSQRAFLPASSSATTGQLPEHSLHQRQDPEARPRGRGQYNQCLYMETVSDPCCLQMESCNRAHYYNPQLN